MNNTEKIKIALFVIIMSCLFLCLLVVLYFEDKDQKEVNGFEIPSDYCLVKYDEDNFVVMDSARTKFLIYWDDDTYSMETNMGNLKGSEIYLKRHLMGYIKQQEEEYQKIKFQEKVRN